MRLGQEQKFQVILLEIPVFCTQEWNGLHRHITPKDFEEQDQKLFQEVHLVNEKNWRFR